jgi:hypothetical protein
MQVICASIVRQRLFYQDDLVNNYIASAKRRIDELQRIRAVQCTELQNKLLPGASPELATSVNSQAVTYSSNQTSQQQQQLPPQSESSSVGTSSLFSRQNTLLAPGKSKFYTLSHEQHCLEPPDVVTAAAMKSVNMIKRVGSSCVRGVDENENASTDSGVVVTATDFIELSSSTKHNGTLTKRSDKEDGKSKSQKYSSAIGGTEPVERKASNNNSKFAKNKNFIIDSGTDQSSDVVGDSQMGRLSNSNGVSEDSIVCMHAGLPNSEYLCSLCYQAKCYSRIVGYATAVTKF